MKRINCIIMGAAGRDFHDFQTFFRNQTTFHVCAFTATQIPFIDARSFPAALAGPGYEQDIPIFPEEDLADLIEQFDIDFVFLAYSDLPYDDVMSKASVVQSSRAAFAVLGPKQTQLRSTLPVVAITATRTGAGKSPIAQYLARLLISDGLRVGVLRHPMPYGDLAQQAVQKFSEIADLDRHKCTVEEREEYEPYLERGIPIYAGVDYARILEAAEEESEVIIWDGGNNDYSFIRPTLSIVVADALRPGHGVRFYPGETNLRSADVVVINKVGQASADAVAGIKDLAARVCPDASVLTADLEIDVDDPERIAGRRVLAVEDGPTLTHGGMAYGAAAVAARRFGAAKLIDPRPVAVGSIADALRDFPHLEAVLPALGYSETQRSDLEATIRACDPDVVVDASPANLRRWIDPGIPVVRVRYSFAQISGTPLEGIVRASLAGPASPSDSTAAST